MQDPNPEGTVSVVAQKSCFRCACGTDVDLMDGRGTCHSCGRAISLAALDPSQTVSLVSYGANDERAPQPGVDRSGEQLLHFRLISKLGEGGMGVVYRALDESLQRFVAVKVMRCTDADGSSAKRVTRLLDEAVAQARLNHPHVVTIYYVGRDRVDPFFAMELLQGPTLDKRLLDGPLPYSQIIHYARQVTSALAQATRQNLVHGDIKPSNLIMAGDDSVKLGDFGLALTDKKTTGGISGTLNYLAPELAEGAIPTAQSDMYALGITLFELTFGRRPYSLSGRTLVEQLASHRSTPVEFPQKWPAEVPEEWRNVLERLLAKNPENRYSDYAALDADLQGVSPVGVTKAGLLNRSLAFVADLVVMVLIMLPFALPGLIVSQSEVAQAPHGSLMRSVGLVGFFALLVPAAMTWLDWWGWRTPGRYLFQLRIVDEHGLPLSRRKRLVRSLIRNAPIWLFATTIAFPAINIHSLSTLLGPVDEILLAVNAFPALGPTRRALHDRIVGSHVALDTTKQVRR